MMNATTSVVNYHGQGGNVRLLVIGGTSLFGGKGKARDAVIGGLVIAIIDNGPQYPCGAAHCAPPRAFFSSRVTMRLP